MAERNIKLTLSYDGSGYYGWQVQPDRPTIQEHLERAIGNITGTPSRVAGAGRTDTGVHAIGQVACFRTESNIPAEKFRPALQSQLPDDIVIWKSEEAADDFHAGYASRWKQYRYLVLNEEIPRPQMRRYATRISTRLDLDAMNEAASALVGKHDFRSFESQFPNKATSVRTVLHCRVNEAETCPLWQPGLGGQLFGQPVGRCVYLDIAADGFLYNMVRAIMGTLLKIGIGSWPASAGKEVLEAMDRRVAGPTAPPEGLYLMHVEYDRDFDEVVGEAGS